MLNGYMARMGRVGLFVACAVVLLGVLVFCLPRSPLLAQAKLEQQPKGSGLVAVVNDRNIVRHGFPTKDFKDDDLTKCKTGWEIEWDMGHPNQATPRRHQALRIVSAKFTWVDGLGKRRWLTIVRNIEVAEAFASYDDGSTSFLDIARIGITHLEAKRENLGPGCVAPGAILDSKQPMLKNAIYKEVHDDGIRWVRVDEPQATSTYRGEKLLLWSAFNAVNYCYLAEYDFTDDGRIVCRLGFTAHNLFNRKKNGADVHLHVGCWRLEFDLGEDGNKASGPDFNEFALVKRSFQNGKFLVSALPFPGDGQASHEGSARWEAKEFTTIRAVSNIKNKHGLPFAYDLIPARLGSTHDLRQIGQAKAVNADMDFVNQDFWITHTPKDYYPYWKAPGLAGLGRPLNGKRATVWYSSPAIHVPRTEDFGGLNGDDKSRGAALTTWIEFMLRPRDLFDTTPLHPELTSSDAGGVR